MTSWNKLSASDAAAETVLSEYFGIAPARAEKLNREGVTGVYRVRHTDGQVVLKKLARPASLEWLSFQEAATNYLYDEGFPVAPLLPDRDGRLTVTAFGALWQLRPQVAGRAITTGDADDLGVAAACLQRLHEAGSSRFLASPRCPNSDMEFWLSADKSDIDALIETIRNVAPLTPRDVLDRYRAAFERARSQLDDATYEKLPHRLTHGEFVGSNLILRDGQVAGVIDWDTMAVRPRVADLARGSFFMARRRRGDFAIHEDLALSFLKWVTERDRLEPAERDAVIPFLELMFLPTVEYLNRVAELDSSNLDWYLSWSSTGADSVRRLMTPVLDAL